MYAFIGLPISKDYVVKQCEELFFQNALIDNLIIDVAMPMPSSKIMVWKRALHTYVHVYTYTPKYIPSICGCRDVHGASPSGSFGTAEGSMFDPLGGAALAYTRTDG